MQLAGIPLFSALDEKGLTRVAKGATEIEARPGTTLFVRGDPCVGLYAVISGRVKLAMPATDGGEKVVALLGPGQILGESAMFLEEPHLVSAETLGPAKLVLVSRDTVLTCMKRDPGFAGAMVKTLSGHLSELLGHIESSTMHSGTQRVIDFLIGQLPDVAAQGPSTITLPAKKRIIASQLDLTHEHFSRILHDLAAAGLLIVEGANVTIFDVCKLRAFRKAT